MNETPRLTNGAERRVWEALTAQAGPGDLVIPGKRVTDHLKDHEVDFVVVLDGAGIVCVEVKGGEITHDGHTWLQRRRDGLEHEISPVRQAREACYALRSFRCAPIGKSLREVRKLTLRVRYAIVLR